MKKWMIGSLVVVCFSVVILKLSSNRVTLTYQDESWYHNGDEMVELDMELIQIQEADVINIIASGETRMEHLAELVWHCKNKANVDLIFENSDTHDSVEIAGLSKEERREFDSKLAALQKSKVVT